MVQWKRENGLNFQLHNFPQVLSSAWEKANSSLNIKNGFKATGIWPLNPDWLQENKSKIDFNQSLVSPTEKFEKICMNILLKSPTGQEGLINNCKYLDLALPLKKSYVQQESNNLEKNCLRS